MYKRLILITLLLIFAALYAEEPEIYSPLPYELPPPYDLLKPSYSYTEIGVNSDYRAIAIHSWTNSTDRGRLFFDISDKGKLLFDVNTEYIKSISHDLLISVNASSRGIYDEYTLSCTGIDALVEYGSEKANAALMLPIYYSYTGSGNVSIVPGFDIEVKGKMNMILFSKWQDLSIPLNSDAGLGISINDNSGGIEFSRILMPFADIAVNNEKGKYKFSAGFRKTPGYSYRPLYNNLTYDTLSYVLRDIYAIDASVSAKHFMANAHVFCHMDSINSYSDLLACSVNAYINCSYTYNSENLLMDQAFVYHYSELFNGPSAESEIMWRNGEYILSASGSIFYNDSISGTVNVYAGADNGYVRIIAGIKNLFNGYDPVESMYAPDRTYFMNLIVRTWDIF